MFSSSGLLLLNLALALLLTGLIWTIQWVHYPLFQQVGQEAFRSYHQAHNLTITSLVAPLMVAELAAAFSLLFLRPLGTPSWALWSSVALVLVAWLSTFLLSVPSHERLAQGLNVAEVRFLVSTNWVRTMAWTARSGLLFFLTLRLLLPNSGGS
jgi:hypothetical protein